jgi:hypothetical protein
MPTITYEEKCRKLKYPNESSAKEKVIRYYKEKERRKKIPKAIYLCKDCQGYHITRRKQRTKSHNINPETLFFI